MNLGCGRGKQIAELYNPMKITKHLSTISLVTAGVIILCKLSWDLRVYIELNQVLSKGNVGVSPSLVVDSLWSFLLCQSIVLASLIMSIIGFKKGNRLYRPALSINILTFIYTLIPIGFLLAFL